MSRKKTHWQPVFNSYLCSFLPNKYWHPVCTSHLWLLLPRGGGGAKVFSLQGGASHPNECQQLGATVTRHPHPRTNAESPWAPAAWNTRSQTNADILCALANCDPFSPGGRGASLLRRRKAAQTIAKSRGHQPIVIFAPEWMPTADGHQALSPLWTSYISWLWTKW